MEVNTVEAAPASADEDRNNMIAEKIFFMAN